LLPLDSDYGNEVQLFLSAGFSRYHHEPVLQLRLQHAPIFPAQCPPHRLAGCGLLTLDQGYFSKLRVSVVGHDLRPGQINEFLFGVSQQLATTGICCHEPARIWVEQTRREWQDSQKLLEFLLPMRTHDFPPNAYPSFFSPIFACTQVPRIAAATMEFLHQIK
jgi:hypothetical protein